MTRYADLSVAAFRMTYPYFKDPRIVSGLDLWDMDVEMKGPKWPIPAYFHTKKMGEEFRLGDIDGQLFLPGYYHGADLPTNSERNGRRAQLTTAKQIILLDWYPVINPALEQQNIKAVEAVIGFKKVDYHPNSGEYTGSFSGRRDRGYLMRYDEPKGRFVFGYSFASTLALLRTERSQHTLNNLVDLSVNPEP